MNRCEDDIEWEVFVCRSLLDETVWFTHTDERGDLTDYEHPGRLRAVQRYATDRYGGGRPTQWKAINPDTWQLHRYPCSCEMGS